MDDRHNESQARCVHSIDEDCLQQDVQCRLGMLVGGCNSQQQGLYQALHLRVPDHTSNLEPSTRCQQQVELTTISCTLAPAKVEEMPDEVKTVPSCLGNGPSWTDAVLISYQRRCIAMTNACLLPNFPVCERPEMCTHEQMVQIPILVKSSRGRHIPYPHAVYMACLSSCQCGHL